VHEILRGAPVVVTRASGKLQISEDLLCSLQHKSDSRVYMDERSQAMLGLEWHRQASPSEAALPAGRGARRGKGTL
jgi:hypothetical protein